MSCELRALLLIILFTQLLSAVKITAHNEDAVRKVPNEYTKWPQDDSLLDKIIRIIVEPLTAMEKGPDNNVILRVFSLFGDVLTELAQALELNVTQSFRQFVLQNIERAKSELTSVAKNIDWASQVVNDSLIDRTYDANQWQTKVSGKQRLADKRRLYRSACHILDDLIALSSVQLHKCCNVTMKPAISFCRSFRILLANGSSYMANMARVLNRLNFCLENNSSHFEYTTRCLDFVNNEISNLIEGFDNLISKLLRLLHLKILYSKCCISLALVEDTVYNKNVIKPH